jgi:hypothetical protein
MKAEKEIRPKIFIGVPVGIDDKNEAYKKTVNNLMKCKDYDFVEYEAAGCNIAINRNILFRKYLETDCDYFLGLDSDIEATIEDFEILFQLQYDIVFGAYKMKDREYYCAGYFPPDFPGYCYKYFSPSDINPGIHIYPIHWSGMGFFLAKRNLIESMAKDKQNTFSAQPPIQTPNGCDIMPEDYYFCMRAAKHADIPIHTGLKIKHIARSMDKKLFNIKAGIKTLEFLDKQILAIVGAVRKLPYDVADPILKKISKDLQNQ